MVARLGFSCLGCAGLWIQERGCEMRPLISFNTVTLWFIALFPVNLAKQVLIGFSVHVLISECRFCFKTLYKQNKEAYNYFQHAGTFVFILHNYTYVGIWVFAFVSTKTTTWYLFIELNRKSVTNRVYLGVIGDLHCPAPFMSNTYVPNLQGRKKLHKNGKYTIVKLI